ELHRLLEMALEEQRRAQFNKNEQPQVHVPNNLFHINAIPSELEKIDEKLEKQKSKEMYSGLRTQQEIIRPVTAPMAENRSRVRASSTNIIKPIQQSPTSKPTSTIQTTSIIQATSQQVQPIKVQKRALTTTQSNIIMLGARPGVFPAIIGGRSGGILTPQKLILQPRPSSTPMNAIREQKKK
ncbi:MAG: hypothetical protein EZS28_050795, partial [Streblomastix strix]